MASGSSIEPNAPSQVGTGSRLPPIRLPPQAWQVTVWEHTFLRAALRRACELPSATTRWAGPQPRAPESPSWVPGRGRELAFKPLHGCAQEEDQSYGSGQATCLPPRVPGLSHREHHSLRRVPACGAARPATGSDSWPSGTLWTSSLCPEPRSPAGKSLGIIFQGPSTGTTEL